MTGTGVYYRSRRPSRSVIAITFLTIGSLLGATGGFLCGTAYQERLRNPAKQQATWDSRALTCTQGSPTLNTFIVTNDTGKDYWLLEDRQYRLFRDYGERVGLQLSNNKVCLPVFIPVGESVTVFIEEGTPNGQPNEYVLFDLARRYRVSLSNPEGGLP